MPMASAIQPIHFHFVPEPGEVQVGNTPDGRPIYERTLNRGYNRPALDGEGKEIWIKHPTTAQPLYKQRVWVSAPITERFTPVDDGHGNVVREPWTPESEAEIARQARERKLADAQKQIAAALVDNDIPVDALVNLLKGGAPLGDDATEYEDAELAAEVSYPANYAPGRWYLSNGSKMKGTREEAEAAEAALAPPPGF